MINTPETYISLINFERWCFTYGLWWNGAALTGTIKNHQHGGKER